MAKERKSERLELKRDAEESSSGKKRESGGCKHRYQILAISEGMEYLQCLVCGKNRRTTVRP